MVWVSGPDELCRYVNQASLEYRGRSFAFDQERGAGWADRVHPDDRALCIQTYSEALSSAAPFRMQYRIVRADGAYRWVEDTAVPIRGEDGAFSGFVGVCAEVDQERHSARTPDREADRLLASLTNREREVLRLIADGKSTKETATYLGISVKTADSHRSRILEKLNVHETVSLVRIAIRGGLIDA